MKILAVNIAFRTEDFYKRWRMLTEMYDDVEVMLIGPEYYEYHQAGPTIRFNPTPVTEEKFKVRHIDMKPKKILFKDWWSWEYFRILKKEKPDFVYLIGYEMNHVVILTRLYKILYAVKLKIALFTMRGTDMPWYRDKSILKKAIYKTRWNINKNVFDFVNVHYPKGKEIIKQQGNYQRPVYLQTQIGVDKDVYYPDDKRREEIRNKYNIHHDEWVFCSAIRIEEAKGVFDIIEACKNIDMPFKYLLMGNGKHYDNVKSLIIKNKLENKIILTDTVSPREQVAAHMNASDCLIHVPITTTNWVDTFPLAVVQGMASGLPVICSDSGAMPYQVGRDGIVVPEGNPVALAEMMIKIMNDRLWTKSVGNKMLARVLECFEIRHLNKCLYQTIKAHLDGEPERAVVNQVNAYN